MTEFRKMRRFKQKLDRDVCLEIIGRATSGVLSVIGDEGYPYGVPLSFAYVDQDIVSPDSSSEGSVGSVESGGPGEFEGSVGSGGSAECSGIFYFHCAKTGHKIDAIRSCDKACFTIIDRDDVVADEFTTYFRSVICFGRARLIESDEEKRRTVALLAKKYSPDETEESRNHEIDREFSGLAMIEFTVEHMTGKEAIELVRKRAKYDQK